MQLGVKDGFVERRVLFTGHVDCELCSLMVSL